MMERWGLEGMRSFEQPRVLSKEPKRFATSEDVKIDNGEAVAAK